MKPIQEREEEFQTALKEWTETRSKNSWDVMFFHILDCCTNILKKKAVGIRLKELDETALEAALYCMHLIRDNGARPEKLSSWCYLPVKRYLYSERKKLADKMIMFSDIQNEELSNNSIGDMVLVNTGELEE